MICKKCGRENDVNSMFCTECGEPLFIQPSFDTQPISNQNGKKNKKKVLLIVLIIIAVLSIIAATFAILILNNIICLNHSWEDATCVEPKKCEYCDKTEQITERFVSWTKPQISDGYIDLESAKKLHPKSPHWVAVRHPPGDA